MNSRGTQSDYDRLLEAFVFRLVIMKAHNEQFHIVYVKVLTFGTFFCV